MFGKDLLFGTRRSRGNKGESEQKAPTPDITEEKNKNEISEAHIPRLRRKTVNSLPKGPNTVQNEPERSTPKSSVAKKIVFSDETESDDIPIPPVQQPVPASLDLPFSKNTLVPLGSLLQAKFEIGDVSTFPKLLESSLEAHSFESARMIDQSAKIIQEIQSVTSESVIKTDLLSEAVENLSVNADQALERMKNSHKEIRSILATPKSIAIYIVLFLLSIIRLITSFFNLVFGRKG